MKSANSNRPEQLTALVTGASSGIGLEYARQLAADYGYDLLLVSNQEAELQAAAQSISQLTGRRADTLCCNLARPEAAEEVYAHCRQHGIRVDMLVNDAGVFYFNRLDRTEPSRMTTMLNLHVLTVAQLCRLFGVDMVERGQGYILNMSSMSAWMAMPGIQCYNASKAFILNFSRSLWYEWKPLGVSVTAVCPGAVDTGLYGLSAPLRRLAVRLHVSLPPEELARKALRKTFKGRKQVMPGALNHLFVPLIKHLPDWLVFAIMKRIGAFMK